VKRKRVTSDQTPPELKAMIRRLKSVITQASNQAAVLEALALHSQTAEAAFCKEQAQDLRNMAQGASEVLLKIEKFRIGLNSHPVEFEQP
jgi:hypothetical protein